MPSACANADVKRRNAKAVDRLLRNATVLCGALLATVAARSDDGLGAAEEANASGRFLECAELAQEAGTSEGLAFAAMCLGSQAEYLAAKDAEPDLVARAMALADEAIRLDPDNADAYLQSARAIGLHAGIIGNLRAIRQGLAGKTRDLVLAALERAPDEPEAHLGLAGWHADIVAAGFIARAMFKEANKADAVKHYERALELGGDSKLVRLEYARRLPKLDRKGGRERARSLLSEAAAFPVGDFSDGLVHEDVLKELAALE